MPCRAKSSNCGIGHSGSVAVYNLEIARWNDGQVAQVLGCAVCVPVNIEVSGETNAGPAASVIDLMLITDYPNEPLMLGSAGEKISLG
jgi:hypothetical protein